MPGQSENGSLNYVGAPPKGAFAAASGAILKSGLCPIWRVEVYVQDVRVRRPVFVDCERAGRREAGPSQASTDPNTGASHRGRITGFSRATKARLVFAIRNAPGIVNEITLTYPHNFPVDGQIVKRDIAAMGKRLKRKGIAGVWYLEFQKRGAPHFHLLTDGSVKKAWLSQAWYEVVGSGDVRHLRAGTHIRKIKKGERPENYAVKLILGAAQKVPPPEYANVGRYWAMFGRMKPVPVVVLEFSSRFVAPIIRLARRAEHAARRARGIPRRRRDSGQWGRTIFGVAPAVLYALSWCPPLKTSAKLFSISVADW